MRFLFKQNRSSRSCGCQSSLNRLPRPFAPPSITEDSSLIQPGQPLDTASILWASMDLILYFSLNIGIQGLLQGKSNHLIRPLDRTRHPCQWKTNFHWHAGWKKTSAISAPARPLPRRRRAKQRHRRARRCRNTTLRGRAIRHAPPCRCRSSSVCRQRSYRSHLA